MILQLKKEIFSRILHIGNITLLHHSIVVARIVEYAMNELSDEELICIVQGGDAE